LKLGFLSYITFNAHYLKKYYIHDTLYTIQYRHNTATKLYTISNVCSSLYIIAILTIPVTYLLIRALKCGLTIINKCVFYNKATNTVNIDFDYLLVNVYNNI
jgi:hypothetical protein